MMIPFLKLVYNKRIVALLIYFLTNTFFILKYSDRQEFVSRYFVLFVYVIFVFLGMYFLESYKKAINKIKNSDYYFLLLCFMIFLVFVFINFLVDGNNLNADRWSAMDVTIGSVLNGEYPYGVKDHLGQTSSNLPALFYVGLPFYLLGDVGLLQPFVFLVASVFMFKSKISAQNKFLILFLLIMSPSYLWEIVAKSDLMSNIILLILFLFYWNNKFKNNYFKKPFLLSFFCAFFVLTRGIVVIPLTLFFFKSFLMSNLRVQLKFSVGFIISIVLVSLPVLVNLPNLETIIEHNPFNHQTKFTPKAMQLIFIAVPFFLAMKVTTIEQFLYYSHILLSLLLFISFGIICFKEGFNNSLYKSYFDISYLGIIIPFSVLIKMISQGSFGFNNTNNNS